MQETNHFFSRLVDLLHFTCIFSITFLQVKLKASRKEFDFWPKSGTGLSKNRHIYIYVYDDDSRLQWHLQRPVSQQEGLLQRIQLWTLGRQLKQQLLQDRNARLGALADQAAACPPSQVYAKLRSLGVCGKRKRRAITPLPMLHPDDIDGHPQERWRTHFEDLEDGIQIEPAQLLADCDRIQRARPTILPDFHELPTLLELEHAFRANARGKACFFDGIPTELAHHFPQHLAHYFFPIMIKQALLISEPVTFKGGVLVHAYKGKGAMGSCESYRSLMISSIFSKSVHRILRRQAVKHLEDYRVQGQLGGLPGKAVTQAAHILTSWAHWQKAQKRSTAVIFVDVRQAFYRLLRAHLTEPTRLDDDVARLFGTLELPAESFQEFANEIATARALQQSGMSPYMEAHLEEVLHGTWFSLPGDCRLSKTRKGTRPGDNLADLLFSFVFARLLRRLMSTMEEEGVSFNITDCCEPHPFPWQLDVQNVATLNMFGPVWADDLAVMISAASPGRLISDTRRTAGFLFDQFAISGMDVNLGVSKTEIVLTLRGAKAPAIRRELFRHAEPCLDIESRLVGTVHVRLVQTYRHLGTVFATNSRMIPEIRQKIGHAKAEFRLHRKKVYSQSKLTSGRRIQLFKSLILSGLLYNIAIWPPLSKQETDNFATGIMSLYASLAYAIWDTDTFSWRDERILSTLSMPSPEELLRMARLRYLQHIVQQGDQSIWTILHADGGWLRLVEQDLEWMRSQIPWRVPQTDPRDEWTPWEALIRLGKPWKGLVAKAGQHAERQRKKHSDWYDWHRTILTMLAEHGIWQDHTTAPRDGFHACLKCRMRFATKAAWSVHAFKIHGRVTPARTVASGVECLVCLRRYGSHDRLVNHLRYSERCQKEHRRRMLFATPQPSANSSDVRKVHVAGALPVLAVQGPMMEPSEQCPTTSRTGWDLRNMPVSKIWRHCLTRSVQATLRMRRPSQLCTMCFTEVGSTRHDLSTFSASQLTNTYKVKLQWEPRKTNRRCAIYDSFVKKCTAFGVVNGYYRVFRDNNNTARRVEGLLTPTMSLRSFVALQSQPALLDHYGYDRWCFYTYSPDIEEKRTSSKLWSRLENPRDKTSLPCPWTS